MANAESETPLASGNIYINRKLGAVTNVLCIGGFQWRIEYDRTYDAVVGVLLNPTFNSTWSVTIRISEPFNWNSVTNSRTLQLLSDTNRRFVFANEMKNEDLKLKLDVFNYRNVRLVCCYDFSEKNAGADRTLSVGNQKFHVESHVLGFYSDYFAKIFEGGFKEAGNKEIKLDDVGAEHFGAFLNCIFPQCKSPINDDNLEILVRMADFYCCSHVKAKCVQYLKNSKFDSVKKYDIAHQFNLPMNCAKLYDDMLNNPKDSVVDSRIANFTSDTKDALLYAVAGCRPSWLKDLVAED